jgi:hypothetical protein
MPHSLVHRAIAVILLACSATPVVAGGPPIRTDANLVTALDVSDSIMRHEEWLEFEGLAKAVTSAALLDAIAHGQHGRIGFAVFNWSSGGRFELLVPWTLIASTADAEGVATMLRGAPRIGRPGWVRYGGRREVPPTGPDLHTDTSATIEFRDRSGSHGALQRGAQRHQHLWQWQGQRRRRSPCREGSGGRHWHDCERLGARRHRGPGRLFS